MIAGIEIAYDIKDSIRNESLERLAESILNEIYFSALRKLQAEMPRGVSVFVKSAHDYQLKNMDEK